MKKLLLILGLILFTSNVKAQVINWVEHEWQADITVHLVRYKWEADLIICKTNQKYKTNKPGIWWWDENGENGRDYSSNRLNVCRVEHKWQADYTVYLSTHEYEIKLTDEYLNEIK